MINNNVKLYRYIEVSILFEVFKIHTNIKFFESINIQPKTNPPEPPSDELLFSFNIDKEHENCDIKPKVPKFCETTTDAAHLVAKQFADNIYNCFFKKK